MNYFFFALLCLSAVLAAENLKHECVHDDVSASFRYDVQELNFDDANRRMQNVAPRNMKITYDMTYFNSLNLTDPINVQFKNKCEQALKIALQYFTDLITIVPKPPGSMKWNLGPTCGLVNITDADRNNERDSDLHLYVSYSDEIAKPYLAYAGWCKFLKVLGPTHGTVNFNLGKLRSYDFNNTIVFNELIQIVTHEITHVLGFSGNDVQYWVDSTTKKPHVNPISVQLIRGFNSTVLQTPNVQAYARQYYGCPSLAGMLLENQGTAGSAGSHWETTVIKNEYMNAAVSNTQGFFSKFTTSLLKDTGFYASINSTMEEQVFYGKDAGCSFINGTCDQLKREFCKAGAQQCDYYHFSSGICNPSSFSDAGCDNIQAFSNSRCYDPSGNYQNNPTFLEKLGVGFGSNSRCFMSSLSDISGTVKEQGLCYNYTCNNANQVIIQVGNNTVTCSQNNQIVTSPKMNGSLKCPEKLDQFCNYKKVCPNFCSSNGYCVNGICKCIAGFKGVDCSKTI
ncbi:leishmanolysin family protein (macronuclear) [Tetrahymena thermophila SB210]|uniref:Leishmanolysin family protein n=1 Tax=Tetrahymena thermophila (strain SB210) TaxID=312017 RepID=I7MF36_TETTS|nr:leishmanolysin family protein [Tetrahymena thermophila SB210]EAR98414.2 leishmanolysin family protein [Tetrahymena thermophila SB210]|eukprot:XP_001018659.2 leishmanolysin family protein [Tetrahymena thermophila SB210]